MTQNPFIAPRQAGIERRVRSPSPLHFAAADGDIDAVKRLLSEGADPNSTAYFGETPLHIAVRVYSWRRRNFRTATGWGEVTRLLLEGGADPMLRCFPDTTPAGCGEGFVPPVLRDAMVVLAERGVWREDDRGHRVRGMQDDERVGTTVRDRARNVPSDMPTEVLRPGERIAPERERLSKATLDAMTARAAHTELQEEASRTQPKPHFQHVRKKKVQGRRRGGTAARTLRLAAS